VSGKKIVKRSPAKEAVEVAVLLVERFPLQLRREVRATAARKGQTLRDAVIEAAEQWLTKQGGTQ